jgi:hypothetical protein
MFLAVNIKVLEPVMQRKTDCKIVMEIGKSLIHKTLFLYFLAMAVTCLQLYKEVKTFGKLNFKCK